MARRSRAVIGFALLSTLAAAAAAQSRARPVQIAVGTDHTCARMSDTTVRCWGDNQYGQLGDGTRVARAQPVAATIAGAVDVQAGDRFTCARRQDGTVLCWGYNVYGQLGTGRTSEAIATPTPVARMRGASALRLGTATACAVVGGQLHCWGRLEPDWDRPNPAPRFVRSRPPIVAASVDDFACVVRQDRSLWCWGSNHPRRPTQVLAAATDVAQGGIGGCAVRADATVACWGWNDSGQLGRELDAQRDNWTAQPVAIAHVDHARRVVAGGAHRCALLDDGTVRCWGATWGHPSFPRACLRTTRHSSGGGSAAQWQYCPTPTAVPGIRGAIDLGASGRRTCALKRDGAVSCWQADATMTSVRL